MAVTLDLDFTATPTLDPRITFSRASLGTYYGSDGLLKYAAHNLQLQSQTFDNASWVKAAGATVTADAALAPDGTMTADRLNHVTGVAISAALNGQGSQTLPAIISVYAKAGTNNFLALARTSTVTPSVNMACFDLATGTLGTRGSDWVASGMEDAGNGWYRCWARSATQITGSYIRGTQANNNGNNTTNGDIYLWGAQLEWTNGVTTTPSAYIKTTTVEVHAPRFDYDPVSHAAKGLLIEASFTNSLTNSQDFTNATYTKTGITVTADQTVAPDGTTTADLITVSASPATLTVNFAVTDGQTYVMSVFAKKGTTDWFYLCGLIGAPAEAPKAWFNLNTGVVGTVEAGVSAGIQNVGSGWYRCWLTRTAPTGGTERWNAGVCDADGSAAVTVGKTAYFWGGQFEIQGTSGLGIPTSYIPTGGSTVTRSPDVAVMTGTNFSSWFNASAGTFVAEFSLLAASGTRAIISADGGSTAEQILLYSSGSDPKAKVRDNSVDQADLDLGTIAA
jgi:hypothetical protein